MIGKNRESRASKSASSASKTWDIFTGKLNDFQVRQSALLPIAHANGWRPLLRIPNVGQAHRAFLALHELREKLYSETERWNG